MEPDSEGVGEIAIQGPNVMRGYFKDPDGTAMSFRDGWFLSGDLGYLDAEGHLVITGRCKEVIVLSTGKNIYPDEVEAHYLKSPYIKEICLLGIDEPEEARTVGIAALVIPNFDYLKAQRIANSEYMIRWEMENFSRELPGYKRPTRLHIVKDPLPRTRLGKIQRHLVRQMYLEGAVRATLDEERAPTETDEALWESSITQKVLTSVSAVARKKKGIRLDDNLELDLGLDSLTRIELVVALEEQFGIDLPTESGSQWFTVRDVVLTVQEHLQERPEAVQAERESRRPPWEEILAGEPPESVQVEISTGKKPWALVITFLSHLTLRVVFKLLCRFRVHGLSHVPNHGPYIIAPNHCSYIDGFVVGTALPFRILRHMHFLGLQIFFRNRITAFFGRAYRIIQVDAETYLFQALRAAAHVLRQGEILCVFPEGGRSIDGEIKPFKKGVVILAKEGNLPLLPVRIIGSFEIWPRGRSYPRPYPLTIIFGPPVRVEELLAQEPIPPEADLYEVIAARLRERVAALAV